MFAFLTSLPPLVSSGYCMAMIMCYHSWKVVCDTGRVAHLFILTLVIVCYVDPCNSPTLVYSISTFGRNGNLRSEANTFNSYRTECFDQMMRLISITTCTIHSLSRFLFIVISKSHNYRNNLLINNFLTIFVKLNMED